MKLLVLSSLLVLALSCASVETKASSRAAAEPGVAAAQFEKIKSLAGEWGPELGAGETAEPGETGETRFRLTAGGSAVEETLFPGTPHEMVTFYHLDGDRLMLTHYCVAGNQPRMVARSSDADRDGDEIRFDYLDATNLASLSVDHMHSAEMRIAPGRLQTQWTFFKAGEPAEVTRFYLVRKNSP